MVKLSQTENCQCGSSSCKLAKNVFAFILFIQKSTWPAAFLTNYVEFYLRKPTSRGNDFKAQLQVKHKNTLNWTAKCSVTKTFSHHSNKLETVSNNTQSASQLGGETKPIYYWPTYSNDPNFQYAHAYCMRHIVRAYTHC